ncbi:unnamed protein product [Rotaria sp. Silwood2]|nr:unnamed protein product [Rotaria sp. Silwood2]
MRQSHPKDNYCADEQQDHIKSIEEFHNLNLSLPIPSREQIEKYHLIQYGTDDQLLTTNQQIINQNQNNSWLLWFYSLFKNLWTLTDELTGDNMYSCEKCRKLRNRIKYCKVVELPEENLFLFYYFRLIDIEIYPLAQNKLNSLFRCIFPVL